MNENKLKTVASSILRDEGQELIDASERISNSVVQACEIWEYMRQGIQLS